MQCHETFCVTVEWTAIISEPICCFSLSCFAPYIVKQNSVQNEYNLPGTWQTHPQNEIHTLSQLLNINVSSVVKLKVNLILTRYLDHTWQEQIRRWGRRAVFCRWLDAKGILFAVPARGGKQSASSLTSLVKASIGRGREAQKRVRTISYVHHITPTPNQTLRHPSHLEGESKINGHYKALQLSAPRPFRSAIIFCLFSKLRDSLAVVGFDNLIEAYWNFLFLWKMDRMIFSQ